MRKNILFFILCVFVCGCAPYKVVKGTNPPASDKGYVVLRDGVMLPEYTVGENGAIPRDITLARERFKRRRKTVEEYYKKMDVIENRFKENIPDRLGYMGGILGSVFTLPARTVKSYRYAHDEKYRERIDSREAQKEALEAERLKALRAELAAYIKKDLEEEKARGQTNKSSSL